MDKPIPEAVLDRLAHEVYQVHCDTPILAFPNDSHWPKWRAVVQHVADHLTAAQQQGQAVAWCALTPSGKIAYFDGKPMFMVGPVGNEHHTTPLYTAPQPTQQDGGEVAMEAWNAALNDAGELRSNAPDERYERRAQNVEAWIKANRPAPPSAPVGVDAPLSVFSAGTWTYETGQAFSADDLDGAAFAVYRPHLAQQPAAVDGAMAERFCRRWYEITGRSLERAHVLASLDFALTQHQEPTTCKHDFRRDEDHGGACCQLCGEVRQ